MEITLTSALVVKRMPNAEEFLRTTDRAPGSTPGQQPPRL
jgi:hypothetical protein